MEKKKKRENKKQISKKEKEESSELEEEIKELEEKTKKIDEKKQKVILDTGFRSFMKPVIESFSPVLEKVETSQQESLEGNVASAPILIQDEKDIETNYETGYKEMNKDYGSKKSEQEMGFEPKVNLNQIEKPIDQFNQKFERKNLETDYIVKIEELKETKTNSPIEQQKKNYDFR